MKSTLKLGALSILLFSVGFLIGLANSSQPLQANKNNNDDHTAAVQKPIIQQTALQPVEHDISHDPAAYLTDESEPDISAQLSAPNADDRLDALYFVWRNHLTDQYQNEIAHMASEDTDLQICAFAQWVLGEETDSVLAETSPAEITITDINNPDDQLKAALIADPYQFQQANQQPHEDQRLLDRLPQLTEDEQLAYIKELSESQEDDAVSALNELVLHYDPILKNAAIEGLFSLLEMRTGHFDSIVNSLKNNLAYLNEEQLQVFNRLSQPDTSSSTSQE
jgi:hypothetical protein